MGAVAIDNGAHERPAARTLDGDESRIFPLFKINPIGKAKLVQVLENWFCLFGITYDGILGVEQVHAKTADRSRLPIDQTVGVTPTLGYDVDIIGGLGLEESPGIRSEHPDTAKLHDRPAAKFPYRVGVDLGCEICSHNW